MFTRIRNHCSKESVYQIGSWRVTLRTGASVTHPKISFPSCLMKDLIASPGALTIWHYPSEPEASGIFRSLLEQATPTFPFGLQRFYEALRKNQIDHLPFSQHCNRYYSCGQYTLIDFPYSSDQFQIVFCHSAGHIYLFGPESSIRRMIHDLCCVMAEYLPLHGSAAAQNGKAVCFLGDSGSGKTYALMNLLQHGYAYLADDELFLQDGMIYCVTNGLQIRSGNPSEFFSKRNTSAGALHIPTAEYASWDRGYILTRPDRCGFFQPFPCVARQSFWWLIALSQQQIQEMNLTEKVRKSKELLLHIQNRSTPAQIDFQKAQAQMGLSPAGYTEKSYLTIGRNE